MDVESSSGSSRGPSDNRTTHSRANLLSPQPATIMEWSLTINFLPYSTLESDTKIVVVRHCVVLSFNLASVW